MSRSRPEDSFDPYAELQLSPDAEPELIKAAFKALAKKYHPDRYSNPREKARAEERMARINEAQRMLQSGQYRPPPPPATSPSPGVGAPPSEPPPPPRPTPPPAPKAKPRKVSSVPFALAAIFLFAVLVLPGMLSGDHLEKALQLEDQGKYSEALQELNKAVASAPHDRALYRHRARIWEALDEPEKAAVDRRNGEEQPTLRLPGESTPADNSTPGP